MSVSVSKHNHTYIGIGYIETITCICTQAMFVTREKKSDEKESFIYEIDVKFTLS